MSNMPLSYNAPSSPPPPGGYPAGGIPPFVPAGSPPPQRNNRRWLWIGGGIAGVLLLCCVGVAALFGTTLFKATAGPRDATNGYFNAVKARDYATARTYLSASLGTATTAASLQATWSQREGRHGAVTGFSINSTDVQYSGTATVGGTLKYANGGTEAKTLTLVKENGAWKLTTLP